MRKIREKMLPLLSLVIYANLTLPQNSSYSNWLRVYYQGDHSNYGPAQNYTQWTNISVRIPYNASALQLTGQPLKENPGAYLAKVVYCALWPGFINRVNISVIWWADPWLMHVGWLTH